MRTIAAFLGALGLLSYAPSAPGRAPAIAPRLAAPQIMMFHGGPLPRPLFVASRAENLHLLASRPPHEAVPPGRRSSGPRPAIKLALFWGTQWRLIAESPERLATLTPEQSDERGEYLPAIAGDWARIRVGATDGPVSDSGLAVLRRHGVPTRAK